MRRATGWGVRVAMVVAVLVLGSREARAQMLPLNAGFAPDPTMIAGMAGGPVDAHAAGDTCRGWINPGPNAVMVTRSGFRFLRVYAQSSADLTLVVRGPTGTFCADDTYGLNPGLDLGNLPPGRYEVFVGSYASGVSPQFTLTFTESPNVSPNNPGAVGTPTLPNPIGPTVEIPGTTNPTLNNPGTAVDANPLLHADMAPRFGRLEVHGAVTHPLFSTGRTSGTNDAHAVHGTGTCTGFLTDAPSYSLTIDRDQPFVRVFVTSAADTTLVLRTPDGHVQCNDDSFNTLHPSLDGAFPAGVYQIWVGVYRAGVERPFRIAVTSDPSLHP